MSENTSDGLDKSLFPSQDDFANAQNAWNAGGELSSLEEPVGTHQGCIRKATLGRSQSSSRLQISYEIEVMLGESKGVKLRKYDGLETPMQVKITQSQLARLGIKVDSIEKLPAALLTLIDKPIVFSAKKNGQYYNINFQRLIVADGENPTGFSTVANSGAAKAATSGPKKF